MFGVSCLAFRVWCLRACLGSGFSVSGNQFVRLRWLPYLLSSNSSTAPMIQGLATRRALSVMHAFQRMLERYHVRSHWGFAWLSGSANLLATPFAARTCVFDR